MIFATRFNGQLIFLEVLLVWALLYYLFFLLCVYVSCTVFVFASFESVSIQGVTGGTDQTSGGCSLC